MIDVEFNVARHEYVQSPVAVVVSKAGAGAPSVARAAELFGHVRERSVSIMVIEPGYTIVADIEVGPSVVVIVSDGDAHPPPLIRDARLVSHVFKPPIAEIVVERGPGWLLLPPHSIKSRAVDQV